MACEDGTMFAGGAEEKPIPSMWTTSNTMKEVVENPLWRAVASERAAVSARETSDSSADPRFEVPEKKMATDAEEGLQRPACMAGPV